MMISFLLHKCRIDEIVMDRARRQWFLFEAKPEIRQE